MTETTAQLTTAEKLQVRQSAERLSRRFEGQLNTETIERFLYDSLDRLLGQAWGDKLGAVTCRTVCR